MGAQPKFKKTNSIAPPQLLLLLLLTALSTAAHAYETHSYTFGPFNASDYDTFEVVSPAVISNGAFQVTPDSAGNYDLTNRSGRVLYKQPFKLWSDESKISSNGSSNSRTVASFNSSFLINIHRVNNSVPGEGMAFIIAPDIQLPPESDGQYLGLTNSTTDGKPENHLIAIELDTVKQDFDPDDNHMGLNINSIRSNKTVSLSKLGIEIAPNFTAKYMVWVQYDGLGKTLQVFMAEENETRPSTPVLTADLDLRDIVSQNSYFGFAASTGSLIELNCVLRWNLTVEILPGSGSRHSRVLKIALGVGIPLLVIAAILAAVLVHKQYKKRRLQSNTMILGTLKSLPGTPREFSFRDLKKATNNFDEKNKLGQGGFGVVYKGVLPTENLEVAVKKFSRDNLKGQDDFLAELTIINRLRHRHLVKLVGWCHKNGVLLLVYDYMPNGSLDSHLFSGPEKQTLEWSLRHKIICGVASALHYLHNEYDQKVVHRDLKASNIMLDSNFNARLGDFGLARALENEKTSYAEIEGIPGTMGYIAPECFHTGRATRESDIYGFGAVVLELVCGQRPWTKIDEFQFLVDWVWSLHRHGRLVEAVDQRLGSDYVVEEAEKLLLLGLACSHPIAGERPNTQAIVQIISGSVAPPIVPPLKPSFVWPSMPDPALLGGLSSMTVSTTTSQFGFSRETNGNGGGYHCDSSPHAVSALLG